LNSLNPQITVYITSYNYGKYIERAIESVLNQTFTDFELLIIDDGSIDNSKEIIEKYKTNQKVAIIYQKNKGLVVTNNIALHLARGKYIIRLDADDYFDHNALLLLYNKIESDKEIGLVYPDYFIVDENDNILNIRKREDIEKVSLKDNPAHGACTLIRTEFLKQIGGYDEQFCCQDGYYLWINFVTKYKVANVTTPLFYYRRHSDNLTNNSDRIYNTRASIKSRFFDNNIQEKIKIFAVIPFRYSQEGKANDAFSLLGGKTLIERKIDYLINVELIKKIVISTPDKKIINFVSEKYKNSGMVLLHHRDEEYARINSGLAETIHNILEKHEYLKEFDAFLTTDTKYPFVDSNSIEAALKTIFIFNSDSLLTVRPDNSRFFTKNSEGLIPLPFQEKMTKLERDDLYRYSGGIIITKMNFFLNSDDFVNKKTGHFIVNELSSFSIENEFDLNVGKMILKEQIIE